jgi:hypothetical protein
VSTTGHREPWAPPDHHWVWLPTSEAEPKHAWEVLAPGDRAQPCRWGYRAGKSGCGAVPVARLNTSTGEAWPAWAYYCGRHLFTRQIRAGVLYTRVLVSDEEAA